ncbi:DUF1801 domain-containing protein [Tenacibaculum aestuariivivum]|uniref:DUF1801 domain-containing protein n=1 Tax=Tenacibaculum aestuariivivum TaxID=2006131 RepID=UPI003AB8E8A9
MKPAEIYILKQKEPLKAILIHLQILIEANFQEAVVLYKWKMPFYYINNKPLCYLNATKKGYVDVGFYSTTALKNYNDHLVLEKRKAVKSLRYYTVEAINNIVLIDVLREAYIVNGKK